MKVLFDFLSLRYSHKSGIFLYAQNILDGWHSAGVTGIYILTHQWDEDFCKKRYPNYEVITLKIPDIKGYSKRAWMVDRQRQVAMKNSGCDIFFYPMPEATYFRKPMIPQVAVIHDMYAPKVAKGKQWVYQNVFIPKQLWQSQHIVTISNYSRKALLKGYSFIKDENVSVIKNCIVTRDIDTIPIHDRNYILCVNTLAPYKNAETLLNAFLLIKDCFDIDLIFVGIQYENYYDRIIKKAKLLGVENRIFHLQNISEYDLISLYQHASLFVSPSTLEGFGQTPIEAAIYGCPVITSTETALPETTMGLVNYYSPVRNSEVLANRILDVLNNPPLMRDLQRISETFKNEYNPISQSLKVYNLLERVLHTL